MNKQLLRDLPELVKAGIISEDTAQRIIDYYQFKKQSAPPVLSLVMGILGSLLAGGGILLIVAHNWDELSSLNKTLLSFLPLLIAQLLCGYTLIKKYESAAWRECSSAFLFFTIGAAISLISQIYQVSGSLSGFLLTWTFLALPLVYLFSSYVVMILCLGAITWYAGILGYEARPDEIPYMYAVVILLMIPNYYRLYKKNPGGNFFHVLNWAFVISITITLGAFIKSPSGWYPWVYLLYCQLFCTWYFVGRSAFFAKKRLISNPFLMTGIPGILVIFLMWSYEYLWNKSNEGQTLSGLFQDTLPYLLIAGMALVLYLGWKYLTTLKGALPDPMGFSFLVFFLLILLCDGRYPTAGILMINAWIILVAIYFIHKGSEENHLGILNFGLVTLIGLALCRFFDDRIPFVWRGIFFIAAGAGFFITNFTILRKRKQLRNEP